ncbi:YheC/YheD family protein [Geobacillus sp. MR]|uniref:YheC/YheD family endospore coat-associated protein n=1 Tax=Geobacillus sp. MR TaxID=2508875 RepID=UPI00148B3CE4|nr:YheC/YheD family protein [Geobacillus sp. MR]NNU88511.1 YheC/YheD family protein [Geobacillus sp. MR]
MSEQRTVAVLTEITETTEQPSLGSIHCFCEELAQCAKERGLFFYVTSPSLYLQRIGYQWIGGEWMKRDVPPADVIYNRLHSRQSEHSPLFAELLTRLAVEGGSMFNHRFLHKWEVYRYFEQHEYLHPYLPKTALWSNEDTLEAFLTAFPSVFLKPIHGSQGRGIFRLERSDGTIRLRHSTSASTTTYSSIDTLVSALRRRTKAPMIIQQGLEIHTIDGRPVDFRLLCHRVRNNHWRVTSAVARVAPPDQFVANLARGGELMAINTVLREWYTASDAFQQKQLLKEIAMEAATVLALEAEGLYGELGIDLAIDVHDQPWIIEVNTKPSKQTDMTSAPQTVRPSAKAIIEYCLTLMEEKE